MKPDYLVSVRLKLRRGFMNFERALELEGHKRVRSGLYYNSKMQLYMETHKIKNYHIII